MICCRTSCVWITSFVTHVWNLLIILVWSRRMIRFGVGLSIKIRYGQGWTPANAANLFCSTLFWIQVFSLLTIHLVMPRQFFVGGNFKMNPASRDQLESIISVLNSADLDGTTGAHFSYIYETFNSQISMQRSSLHLRHFILSHSKTRCDRSYSSLLKTAITKIQARSPVNWGELTESLGLLNLELFFIISPAQLVDANIPYVILGQWSMKFHNCRLNYFRPLWTPDPFPRNVWVRCPED
jgi:hypothetical protein